MRQHLRLRNLQMALLSCRIYEIWDTLDFCYLFKSLIHHNCYSPGAYSAPRTSSVQTHEDTNEALIFYR